MHRTIAGVSPIVGAAPSGRTSGITGLVYRSVRGITGAVGLAIDSALALLQPLLADSGSSARREAVLAAINGVLGDYLVASANPLAIPLRLRHAGKPLTLDKAWLAGQFARPGGKLLVLVHGLCMNDLEWRRGGHDHGAALMADLGYTPLYLHYNSGRHISTNGTEFALLLEKLVAQWPVPVTELAIVGHSMGGLVTRGACLSAEQKQLCWLRHLKQLVFLGTPHHGAPLERAGSRVDMLVGISPYTAPLARLGGLRSAGIKDLRHGHFHPEDARRYRAAAAGPATSAYLPAGVRCFALAATRRSSPAITAVRLPGDGLVPVNSALGRHANAALALPVPESRQRICFDLNHFDLLSSQEVYAQIRRWLQE